MYCTHELILRQSLHVRIEAHDGILRVVQRFEESRPIVRRVSTLVNERANASQVEVIVVHSPNAAFRRSTASWPLNPICAGGIN